MRVLLVFTGNLARFWCSAMDIICTKNWFIVNPTSQPDGAHGGHVWQPARSVNQILVQFLVETLGAGQPAVNAALLPVMVGTSTVSRGPRRSDWRASGTGGKVRVVLMGLYPDEDNEERTRTSVRLPSGGPERLQWIADMWNALDKARGRNVGVRWKPSLILERIISAGIKQAADELGGYSEDPEKRAAMVAAAPRAIAKLKK